MNHKDAKRLCVQILAIGGMFGAAFGMMAAFFMQGANEDWNWAVDLGSAILLASIVLITIQGLTAVLALVVFAVRTKKRGEQEL